MRKLFAVLRNGIQATGTIRSALRTEYEHHKWIRSLFRKSQPSIQKEPSLDKIWWHWAVRVAALAASTAFLALFLPAALHGDMAAINGVVMAAFLMLLMASGAWWCSIAHWQRRTGKVGRLKDWFSLDVLIPPTDARRTKSIAFLITIGTLMLPTGAFAASDADFGIRIINAVFSSETPLAAAIHIFTQVLMGGVAAYIGYQILKEGFAVAETADTVAFKNGMGMTRLAVAVGLMIPLPGGISAGQHGLGEALRWGNDLATLAARTFVSHSLALDDGDGAITHLGLPASVGGLQLGQQILYSEICTTIRVALSGPYQAIGRGNVIQSPNDVGHAPEVGISADGKRVWSWSNNGRCGTLSVDDVGANDDSAVIDYKRARIESVAAIIRGIRAASIAHQVAGGWLPSSGVDLPNNILVLLKPIASEFDKTAMDISARYLSSVQGAARKGVIEAIDAWGWIAIGAMYRTLSTVHREAFDLASQPVERKEPIRSLADEEYVHASDWLREKIALEGRDPLLNLSDSIASIADADEDASILGRLMNTISRPLSQAVLRNMQPSPQDAMLKELELGRSLMWASELGMTASIAASFGACNVAVASAGGCAAYERTMYMIQPILAVTFVAGVLLSIVLPLLPFLFLVVGGGVSFIVSVAELVVGAVLFLAAATKIDSREMVHPGGWAVVVLLCAAVFRPVLIILAFGLTYTLLPLALYLLNLLAPAFIDSQGTSGFGLPSIVVLIFVHVWLTWQITVRILGLISVLPDRVLRFINAQSGEADHEGRAATMIGGVAWGMSGQGNTAINAVVDTGKKTAVQDDASGSIGVRPVKPKGMVPHN